METQIQNSWPYHSWWFACLYTGIWYKDTSDMFFNVSPCICSIHWM